MDSNKYISLEGLSKEEVKKAAFEYNIFGRVTPEQKEIIVAALKEEKHVVGMFGDGVNDLLALKASNVGITVGCANSAAKDLANIILYNNDFGSLPDVIAQGRRVINNLQRTCSLFLIKTLYAILINIFFLITAATIGVTYPFQPAHFYGWDVICIGVAAFFLALEKNNEEIVKGSFLLNIFKAASINGVIMAIEVMVLFILAKFMDVGYGKNEIVTFAVYFMAGGSVISLFGVSYPFDKFRLTVFILSIIGTAMIFFLSYVSPWNIVKLYKETPFTHIATIDGIMLAIMIVLTFGLYKLFEKIFYKKKEEK